MGTSTLEPDASAYPGEVPPSHGVVRSRSDWLTPNLAWAVVGGVGGWFFGRFVGETDEAPHPRPAATPAEEEIDLSALPSPAE